MKILSIDNRPLAHIPHLSAGPGGGVRKNSLSILQGRVEGLPPGIRGLFVASDLQGRDISGQRLLGEAVAETLETLSVSGLIPPADTLGILLSGDLYAKPDPGKRGGLGDVAPVWSAFADRFRWVTGILGNHDLLDLQDLKPYGAQAQLLDGTITRQDGLVVGGVSGIIGSPDRTNRRGEADYIEAIFSVLSQKPDILLLHPSPWITGEGHAGSRTPRGGEEAITSILEVAEELVVVCGHMHWGDPLAKLSDKVQILNVDARGILLLPNKETRR